MRMPFLDLLFPPRGSEKLVRSLGSAGLTEYLSPRICLLGNAEVTALLPYDNPLVRACVVEAKFHASVRAAKALGNALAQYLQEELADRALYEQRVYALIPVPLSRTRLRERGYNQVEVITRYAANVLREISIQTDLIARVRDTLPQTALDGRERRMNMRGAFEPIRPPDQDVTYIVVDDVVTTGATISEAVDALRKVGARDMWAIALAH